jgi:hypothetical protein
MLFILASSFLAAQQPFHFNVGGGVGFPAGRTSDLADVSGHGEIGGGITLVPHVALSLEYMYYDLSPKGALLRRLALPDTHAHMHSVTGNLQVAFGTHAFSGYVIGGGGWYKRSWKLTTTALTSGVQSCDAGLLWFGIFDCQEGLVLTDVTIASGSQDAGGWNIGGGFAKALGSDTGAKFYTEVRYHRAYHRGINTEVIPITLGIRW